MVSDEANTNPKLTESNKQVLLIESKQEQSASFEFKYSTSNNRLIYSSMN